MSPTQEPLAAYLLKVLASQGSDVALAYAWCKVCFTAWDATLDIAGERLLRYSRWPEALRLLLHALYPSYFVYSSMKRISGPEGPSRADATSRWQLLLSAACIASMSRDFECAAPCCPHCSPPII